MKCESDSWKNKGCAMTNPQCVDNGGWATPDCTEGASSSSSLKRKQAASKDDPVSGYEHGKCTYGHKYEVQTCKGGCVRTCRKDPENSCCSLAKWFTNSDDCNANPDEPGTWCDEEGQPGWTYLNPTPAPAASYEKVTTGECGDDTVIKSLVECEAAITAVWGEQNPSVQNMNSNSYAAGCFKHNWAGTGDTIWYFNDVFSTQWQSDSGLCTADPSYAACACKATTTAAGGQYVRVHGIPGVGTEYADTTDVHEPLQCRWFVQEFELYAGSTKLAPTQCVPSDLDPGFETQHGCSMTFDDNTGTAWSSRSNTGCSNQGPDGFDGAWMIYDFGANVAPDKLRFKQDWRHGYRKIEVDVASDQNGPWTNLMSHTFNRPSGSNYNSDWLEMQASST